MKIELSKKLTNKYQGLQVGILQADIHNSDSNSVIKLLNDMQTFVSLENDNEARLVIPGKIANFFKYNKIKTNVEKLIKKSGNIKSKNKIVDFVNFLILKHTIPISVYDQDKLSGVIKVKDDGIYDGKEQIAVGFDLSQKNKPTKKTKKVLLLLFSLNKNDLNLILKEAKDSINVFFKTDSEVRITNHKKPSINI